MNYKLIETIDGHTYWQRVNSSFELYVSTDDRTPNAGRTGPWYVNVSGTIQRTSDTCWTIPVLSRNTSEKNVVLSSSEAEVKWVAKRLEMRIIDVRRDGLAVRFPDQAPLKGPEGLPKNAPAITVDDLRSVWPIPSMFKDFLAYSWAAADPDLHWDTKDIPPLDVYQGQPATEHDLIEAARYYKDKFSNHNDTGGKLEQLAGYLAEPENIETESPESYRVYRDLLGDVLQELGDAMRSPAYRCKRAGMYERER